MPRKATTTKKRVPFTPDLYLRCYQLARAHGGSEKKAADAIGISVVRFKRWREKYPAFDHAFRQGVADSPKLRDSSKGAGATVMEYVYKRLPDEARAYWDQLEAVRENHPNDCSLARVRAVLAGSGKRVKQQLFVHALVASNFNKSEACYKVGLSPELVRAWEHDDRGFRKLLLAVLEVKKDFFEGSLVRLVETGDTAATLFVNRTLNRDRGYDPKVTVEHTGTLKHAHFDVNKLLGAMDPDAKRRMLDAIRAAQEPRALGDHTPDAELAEDDGDE